MISPVPHNTNSASKYIMTLCIFYKVINGHYLWILFNHLNFYFYNQQFSKNTSNVYFTLQNLQYTHLSHACVQVAAKHIFDGKQFVHACYYSS